MRHGEDLLEDRVILGLVIWSKMPESQQISYGTPRLIERSGQLYDPQLVPEIDDDQAGT